MKPLRNALICLYSLVALAPIPVLMAAEPTAAPAAPAAAAVAPDAGPAAKSAEDLVRERFSKKVPGKITSVTKTAFGWYEVVVESEIVYVDEAVNYIFSGHVFDTRTQENITAKRSEEVLRVDFANLPLQLAFKVVRGDGSRPVAIFEDPNCPYCKRLESELRTLQNTTIYVFLYPILSDDSVNKSKQVWCSKDPSDAWARLMLAGQALPAPAADCKTPIDDVLALGHKLNVTGTPTLLFADGRRAPGMIPLDKVEQMLNAAAHPQPAAAAH
jgi:thiol:disulfide interchange protein DsbC